MGEKSDRLRGAILTTLLFLINSSCQDVGVGTCQNFSWSPDSQRIAVQTYEAIYVMQIDGSDVRRIDSSSSIKEYTNTSPTWSPDGKSILFSASPRDVDSRDVYQLYKVNIDGNQSVKTISYNGFLAQWSPDGKKIAFQAFQNNSWVIRVMNLDDSSFINSYKNLALGENPIWAPDSKSLLYLSTSDSRFSEIYSVKPNKVESAKKLGNGTSPVWSIDGNKIAFFDRQFKVKIINQASSKETQLYEIPTAVPYNQGLYWTVTGKELIVWFITCQNTSRFSFDICDLRIKVFDSTRSIKLQDLTFSAVGMPPQFSHNGRKLGFISRGYLYTTNLDGSDLKQLNCGA